MNPQLDLGCSSHKREGWIGLDIQELKNVDIIGDAHNLPIRNNVINKIISTKVFEHLSNPYQSTSECSRVLINYGVLILGVPNIHTLRRFLRWMVKGKITVGQHIYCWGLPEIVNLAELHSLMMIDLYFDTYERYHSIGFIERVIRRFNKRIIDKNLNVVFMKESSRDMD